MGLCECGCGESVTEYEFPSQQKRFISGHNAKVGRPPEYKIVVAGLTAPCWIWQRALTNYGYGVVRRRGKQLHAHRVIYEREIGPIPSGWSLHHVCGNRRCVNPAHLQIVSRRRHARIEAQLRAPLDELDRQKIRRLRGELTQAQLARAFEVSQSTISKVLRAI